MVGKTGLLLVLIATGAALTYSVTARLSDQTIDVIVGLLCGVVATIPVSVGLLIALNRQHRETGAEEEETSEYPGPTAPFRGYSPRQPYPPVIVISPQPGQGSSPFAGLLPPGTVPPPHGMHDPFRSRDFKIIGEDDDNLDA